MPAIKYKIFIYMVIYYVMLFVRYKLIILLNNIQICCNILIFIYCTLYTKSFGAIYIYIYDVQ